MTDNENKMSEVAALLGVEIGEEFDTSGGIYDPHKITEDGVTDCNGKTEEYRINRLLTGEWTIIERPYKPENGEKFFFVCPDGHINWDRFDKGVASDCAMVYSGNCFRTEQKAELNRDPVMEQFGWK